MSVTNTYNLTEIDKKIEYLLKEKSHVLEDELRIADEILQIKINLRSDIDMNNQNAFSQITTIIIDDDKDITVVFAEYLKSHGITTLGIGHDGNCYGTIPKDQPEYVFLDVMMPTQDYNLIEELESLQQSNQITIRTTSLGGRYK